MVVLADLSRVDAPVPRHAEVEHERIAAVGVDQPIFGAPMKPDDPRAGQPLAEIDGERAAQIRAARLDPFDAAAVKHMGKAADGRFDFG